jgi:hypothetical protein
VRFTTDEHHGTGEAMTRLPAIDELNLASSGKLKLRATARLAEGRHDLGRYDLRETDDD